MLEYRIESANEDIQKLIEITEGEIGFLKIANREELFSKIAIKEELFDSFQHKKALLDNELVKMLEVNDDKTLETLLNTGEKDLLDSMRTNLENLKAKNKEFAKLLITVGEFYNTLLNRLIPQEHSTYDGSGHKPASIFKMDV